MSPARPARLDRSARPAAFVAALSAPVLAALLAVAPLPEATRPASPRGVAATSATALGTPAQLAGLLRQLNLRARPGLREVNRCSSSACRAATAPLRA